MNFQYYHSSILHTPTKRENVRYSQPISSTMVAEVRNPIAANAAPLVASCLGLCLTKQETRNAIKMINTHMFDSHNSKVYNALI